MKRFYSVSDFYKEKFGVKVYKISLDSGCTCPNRDGTKGIGGCIFCSASGSGDFASDSFLSIKEQIEMAKLKVLAKNKNGKFIAYFQNFTNTYGNIKNLEKKFLESIKEKDIVGLSIGTRPDCLGKEVLEVLARLSKKTFLSIELGLQTSNEKTGKYINRCFFNQDYIEAVKNLKQFCKEVHIVTHLIIGLPFENKNDFINSLKFCAENKTDGIKFSLLYVLKGTKLLEDYNNKVFECLSMNEYFEILYNLISNTPKNIVIHRLTGDGAKNILVSPLWTSNKKYVYNSMMKFFDEKNLIQGSAITFDERARDCTENNGAL